MIDIHTHLLYDVDDGSISLEESLKYLDQIKEVGIESVVCTPHIKNKVNPKIKKHFNVLKESAKKIGINLYLGNEIMYSPDIISLLKKGDILSINNTKYILVEFKRYENMPIQNIYDIMRNIIDRGYIPVLAHPELYINYRDIEFVKTLKEAGVIIQIDATSLVNSSMRIKRYTKKLIKNYLVDVVASDAHCTPKRDFKKLKRAYKKVYKRDKDYAYIIFEDNPKTIIGI